MTLDEFKIWLDGFMAGAPPCSAGGAWSPNSREWKIILAKLATVEANPKQSHEEYVADGVLKLERAWADDIYAKNEKGRMITMEDFIKASKIIVGRAWDGRYIVQPVQTSA